MQCRFTRVYALQVVAVCALRVHTSSADIGERYAADVVPLLDQYCLGCHDSQSKEGELDLERFEKLDDLRADAGVWERVVAQLEDGEMPPREKPQLDWE